MCGSQQFVQNHIRGYPLLDAKCKRCQALWTKYATVTSDHIRTEGKLRMAELQSELEQIATLTLEADAAGKLRIAGREAIRVHEEESHPSG